MSVSPDEARLWRGSIFDETASGKQIYVYWWRIDDPSVVIPGVAAGAASRGWYVSPALHRTMEMDGALRARYPDSRIIGGEGLSSPDELIAHRLVGPAVDLPDPLAPGPATGWIGDLGASLDVVPLLASVAAFVVLPGVGLLVAATAPLRRSGSSRRARLRALGATRAWSMAAAAAPLVLAGTPGIVLSLVAWHRLAPGLTNVPIVGAPVLRGDLTIPWTHLALVAFAVLAITLAAGAPTAGSAPMRGPHLSKRIPTQPPGSRVAPLAVSLVVLMVGAGTAGRRGSELFVVGLLGLAMGASIALPVVLWHLGQGVAQRGGMVTLLVGRRLAGDAGTSARPLLALGSLAVLIPVGASWVTLNRLVDTPPQQVAYATVLRGPASSSAIKGLLAETSAVPVMVAAPPIRAGGPGQNASEALVADCRSLVATGFASCGADGTLVADPGHGLDAIQGLPVLGGRPVEAVVDTVYLLARDGERTEMAVRRWVVNNDQVGFQALAPGRTPFQESPLVGWLLGGARLAGVLAAATLLLHLVDDAARRSSSGRRLYLIGASGSMSRGVAAAEAALVVGLTGLVGAALGATAALALTVRDAQVGYPVRAVVAVLMVVALASLASGVAAGARVHQR